MSAILTSTTANEIEMLADGLVYENDGTIVDRRTKIYVSDRMPMAINIRGSMELGDLIVTVARMCEITGSFESVLRTLSGALADHASRFAELPPVEITIAGLMHGEPQVWRGFTHDMGEQPAFAFWLLDERYVGGAMGEPTPDQWEALGVVPDAPEGVLRTKAVEVMELLRAMPGPVYGIEDGGDVCGVGGHVQYVRIGVDGSVTNEILHEWPGDVAGQKVGVFPDAPPTGATVCVDMVEHDVEGRVIRRALRKRLVGADGMVIAEAPCP